MVVSESTLQKIKEIIENKYINLVIGVLGKNVFTEREQTYFRSLGLDLNNSDSFITMIFLHNMINNINNPLSPKSYNEMEAQQSTLDKPNSDILDMLNANALEYMSKLKTDVSARISAIIRESNTEYMMESVASGIDPNTDLASLMRRKSLQQVKQDLQALAPTSNRDWDRIIHTEASNAVGFGSVEGIIQRNPSTPPDKVYVYRITVPDDVTCRHCRRFYGHGGEIPKIYRLSTLLGNGSNYGKKQDAWLPVVGATHPNTRTSPIYEIPLGWSVNPGGTLSYLGEAQWQAWIDEHLQG